MKSFFKTFFASTLGVLFALFIVSMIFTFTLIGVAASSDSSYKVKKNTVFELNLNGSISDKDQSSPLDALFGSLESMTGSDIISSIKKAKEDKNIKGIYLKSGLLSASLADVEPIRKALLDFKESGKFIVAYSELFMPESYFLSSVADKVIFNPEGTFSFEGLSRTIRFRKKQYDKLGVKYQVFKVGTFKSAVEPYIQEKMSDANREQVTSFTNDMWKNILVGVSESRGLSIQELNDFADRAPVFLDTKEVKAAGMVDELMFEDEVKEYIRELAEVDEVKDVTFASLKNMQAAPAPKAKEYKDKIAVLYVEGQIVNDYYPTTPFMGGSMIRPKDVIEEMKKLQEDEEVKAVVFRVNSPGGSASASEQIWNAVMKLKAVKPVIVSMGQYAASGGYYISSGATSIVAEPSTITGSIGVFGMIPDGTELADKMGLTFDEVGTNKYSTMGGVPFGIPFIVTAYSRGFNEEESALLQNHVEKGYDLFLTRCADGRGMTKEEIDAIGQGRVWTGGQAKEIGLVDELGGIKEAIEIAAEKAGIENYNTVRYPKEKDLMTQIMEEMMGGAKVKVVQTLIGKEAYEQQKLEEQLRSFEFRQALMPEFVMH